MRGGRMVATGTIDDLKRNAARRVTVELREPVTCLAAFISRASRSSAAQTCSGCSTCKDLWGRFFRHSAAFPVHDLHVEAFKLEDFVARHYAGH